MKDKNIYDALHDMNLTIDEFPKMEVSDIEKARMKRVFKSRVKKSKFNFKKFALGVAALAFVVLLFGQTKIGGRVYADVISALSDIKSSILLRDEPEGNKDRYAKDEQIYKKLKPYLNEVNVSTKDVGIEAKLSDVLISEDRFGFNIIFAKQGRKIRYVMFDCCVYINGELMKTENESCSTNFHTDDGIVSENYMSRIVGINTKDDLDIKIKIDKLKINEDSNYIDGNWEFDFIANGRKLAEHSIVKTIDKHFEKDGLSVDFKKLVYNPLDKVIYAEISRNDIDDGYKLVGEDDLGNEFVIGISRQSGKLARFENAGEENFIKIGEGAKYIKLTLYHRRYPSAKVGEIQEDPEFKQFGEPFIVELK